jgi:hypothetical protein
MRVFLIILGILMLLPGACSVLFIGIAVWEGDPGAIMAFALPGLVVGAGGFLLIRHQARKKQ